MLSLGFPHMEQPMVCDSVSNKISSQNNISITHYYSSLKDSHIEPTSSPDTKNHKFHTNTNTCALTSVIISAPQTSICSGNSLVLSATPVGSTTVKYSWSPSGQTSSSVNVSPASTTKYFVTALDTIGGCSYSDSITITVNPTPTVIILASPASICPGASSTLTASGAANYVWSNGATTSSISVSPTLTTTYTVYDTTNGCGGSPQIITVNVNPTPTITVSASAGTICSGSSSTLTVNGAVNYVWSNGATASTITVSPASTTTYTVNGITSGCNSAPQTVTITVNPTPTISVSASPSTICSGSSSTLTVSGAANYVWNNGATTSAIIVSPASTTTFTVNDTTSGCGGAPQTITVNVNPTPTVTISASSGTICSGSSTTLTANGATKYVWSNGATVSSISVSPTTTTTYTLNDTTSGCGGASQTITITVNPTPTVTTSASFGTICSGSSSTLTASGAASYTWSNGATTSSITVSPSSTTTYTVIGTTTSCNSPPQTVVITVNTTPTITASALPATICSGSSSTLSASGATNYLWSNGATASSITVSPNSTTTYTITGTANGCTGAQQIVILTVNPTPTVSLSASATTICMGSSSILTATGAVNYAWSTGATTSSIAVSPNSTTTYVVSGNTTGCTGVPQAIVIAVNPNPTVTVSGGPTTICSGSSSTLSASGATSYVWSNGATTSSVTVFPSSTTIYTVTGTTNGCSDQQTITVNVNPTPTITASASPPSICPGYSSTITATGATTYAWSPSTGLNSTFGSSVIASLTSSVTYTITGTIGSCVSTQTITVNVSPVLPITASASPAIVCTGQSSTLTASGAVTYNWSPSTSLNTSSGPSVIATPTITTTYTIVGVSSTCVGLQTVVVAVNPSPTITITPSPVTICSGSSMTLTASGANTYTWNTGATSSSITVSPTTSTTYSITGSICSNSASQTVNVTVNPTPTITLSASATTICAGSSAVLTASGATSYNWNTGATTSSITVSPTSATTYTVAGISIGCSSIPQTITINVNPTPTVTASASPAAICSGSSTTLSASGATTYSWNTGATTSSITASPATSKTYTVTGTTGTCGDPQTVIVSVTATPTLAISASASTICSGTSTTLTASGAGNYVWNTGATTSTITVSPTSTTTYTLTGSTGACTGTPQTIVITVDPTPTVIVSASATTICSGSSTTLTASGATTYSWNTGATTSSITVSPGSTKTYTVTGMMGGCSSTPQTIIIIVDPTPTVTVSALPATICSGSSSTLTAGGAASYSWSTGETTSSITVSPGTTTIYTVTGTSGACSAQKTITVIVDPTPTVNITASSGTICSGASSTLTASGATSYSWSTGETTSSITVSPGTTTTYTVTGTLCTNNVQQTVTITVNPTPTLSVIASSGTICSGSSATITASGVSNYTWSNGATTSSITISPGTTTTYTVSGSTGACNAIPQTTVITVDPTPTITVNATPTVICSGASSTLTAGGATTYVWSTGATTSSITVSPGANTTYTVTGTTGPCSETQTVTVIVDPTPTVSVSASPPVICSGASSVLSATGATTYLWSTGETTSSITVSPTITTTYSVNGTICTNSSPQTITVVVIATPTVTISASPPTICSGMSTTLTASGATNYSWNTGATTSSITVSPLITTAYEVNDTTGGCGGAIQTATVTVNITPTITASASASSICSGSSTTLTASGAATYNWSTGETTSSITVSPATTTTYTVKDTTNGCGGLPQTLVIIVNPTPTITISATPPIICEGSSSTLTASGASSYSWSTSETTSSITVSPTITTTYSVAGATCGNSTPQAIIVTVTPTPTVSISASSTIICSGTSDTLTATGANNYKWSTGETTSSIIVSPSITTTYTVTDTTSGCGGAPQTFVITVNPTPTVTVTLSPATICPGSSSTLSASGAANYSWSTSETSSSITVSPLITTTYTVTGTTGGCSEIQTGIVNVTPTPTVSILASPAAICSGSSSTLIANGALNYTWSTGATTSSITVSPNITTTYTVKDTTSGCGGAPQTVIIKVTTTPTVMVSASVLTICSGTSTVLTASGADTYNWSTGETASSITVSPNTTTTYTVTDSTGACNGAPQQIIITVNPTPTASVSASPAMICSGSSSTLTASGGIGNYRWSTGATTSAITVSPNTTTTYTLTDTATGCGSIPQLITLTVNTTPTISVTASPSFICPGSSSNLTASGAKAYSWAPDSDLSADTGAMVTATLIGTLTYTITGMNGVCKDTQSIVITVSPMLVLTEVASPSVICTGQSCTLTAGGATSYNWSPGIGLSSTSGISVSASPTSTTTYTLIGTNGTCLGIQTVVIVVNPTPVIASSQTNPLCYGALTGTATALVTNGTFPYNYNWSTTPAQTTSTATALAAGIYTVTVTDMNSCTAVATNTIIQPTAIRDSISSLTNVKCFSNNNGKATVGVKGGTPGYTYLWNTTPAQTLSTATTLISGTYTVAIRDANGCTVNDTAIITQPPLLTPLLIATPALCNDSNGSITSAGTSGGTPVYSYLWSNSTTTSSISAKAGSYTLTVTDAHGCVETGSATINQPTPIAPLLTATPALCNDSNGSITSAGTSGGTPGYSYLWSNSSTASSISAKAGSYTLSVKDANGCIETASKVINQPTPIAPLLTATQALCYDSNGSITSAGTSGGTPGYSYLWSNSSTASSISAKAGSYTLTVTDTHGCIETASKIINQPTPIAALLTATPALCNDSNGSITSVGTSGGTPGYSYLWSNSSTASSISAKAGSYTVTITDTHGCIETSSATINQPTPILPLLTATPALCNDSNGTITSTGTSGGTPGYSYLWSNSSTASSISAKAGSYTLSVIDANGCIETASATINQPTPITPLLTATPALCNDSNGSITSAGTSGGTPGYSYLWSNSSTTSSISAKAGSYTLTVIDANGCIKTGFATINQPTPIVPHLTANPALCNDSNGSITSVGTSGGTPGYSFLWSNSSTASSISAKAGSYTVTITDMNGCFSNDSALIIQPSHLRDSIISTTNEKCFGDSIGSISIGVANGTPAYSYSWAPYGGSNKIATKLTAGIYTVTITDAGGCIISNIDTIIQPTKLHLFAATFPASCNGECNGQLTSTPSGGTSPYSYLWNSGSTSSSALNVCAGTYSITITDSNNCKADSIGLIVAQPLPITASITTSMAHCGQADGGACISGTSGGTQGYSYLWSTGESTTCINNISPAQYYITITDANKCIDTIQYTLANAAGDTAVITASTIVTCFGGSDGTATGLGNQGIPPYSYLWNTSPVQTTQTAVGLAAGTYTLTVTDSTGCKSINVATIQQHTQVLSVPSTPQAICIGQSATLSISTSGGTPGYSYMWLPGGMKGPSVNVSPTVTTTYTISTSDAYSCPGLPVTITVAVNPPLSITVSPNKSACAGGNMSFTSTASGGDGIYTYNWIPNTGLNVDTGATVISTPTINTEYTVTAKDGCGTPAVYDSVKASVNPLPIVKFSVDKLDGCTPLCINFSNLSTIISDSISSWAWTFGDGGASTLQNSSYCYTGAGVFSIGLVAKSDSGCIDSLIIPNMISAYSHPNAAFITSPQSNSILAPTIDFTDESTDAYGLKSWAWQFGDASDSNVTIENPTHTYTDTGTFCTLLTVTNVHGCVDTISHCIVISPYFTLYIPNAFSPNGDGVNDIFTAKGTDICSFEMYIFDRWGMLLYYTSDINDGWNGTVNGSSTIVEEDTYVYLINAVDCVQHNKHKYIGKVTLLK